MISIEGEMRELLNNALDDGFYCYVGTASRDGRPQISMRGSLSVYDGETLAFWERSRRSSLDNVNENPHIVIFYRNPDKRFNWRFHGTATLHESGEVRDRVMAQTPQPELDRDPERTGIAVLIKIDTITSLSGEVLQQREG